MLLSDIRQYLAKAGRAPVSQIATHFDVETEAMAAMLETLAEKGRVRRVEEPASACGAAKGSCGQSGSACCCSQRPDPVYEHVERKRHAA